MLINPNTERYNALLGELYMSYARIKHPIMRINALGHTSMVDSFMTTICLRRGIDLELGKIAALLHDIGKFEANSGSVDHARIGAAMASRIMQDCELFSEKEIQEVRDAILHHSEKDVVGRPMAEALKDADVLASWAACPMLEVSEDRKSRLLHTLKELGIDAEYGPVPLPLQADEE